MSKKNTKPKTACGKELPSLRSIKEDYENYLYHRDREGHIEFGWTMEKIEKLLDVFPGLIAMAEELQRPQKRRPKTITQEQFDEVTEWLLSQAATYHAIGVGKNSQRPNSGDRALGACHGIYEALKAFGAHCRDAKPVVEER